MARKKKPPPEGASKAYLVSFGDTMTALLAFFIVLNSLATEQTGAKLHSGTGSFVNAMKYAGLPGILTVKGSKLPKQLDNVPPEYQIPPYEKQDNEALSRGPDDVEEHMKSNNREREEFEDFMREVDKSYQVKSHASALGEVAFDVFDRIPKRPPSLPRGAEKLLPQVLPLLSNERYRVKVVVWATTPSASAWTRATRQSAAIVQELSDRLPANQRIRLRGVGQPWTFSEQKRPTMSFVVTRLP